MYSMLPEFALQAVANAVHVFDQASWKEEPELSFKILFLSNNCRPNLIKLGAIFRMDAL